MTDAPPTPALDLVVEALRNVVIVERVSVGSADYETRARALLQKLDALRAEQRGDPGQARPVGWRFKYKESDHWNYTENAKAAKRYKDLEYFVQPVYATPEQPR